MDTLRFYELDKLGEGEQEERPILDNFVEEVADEDWRLLKGEPIAKLWPDEARIYLTGEEGGIELCEYIGNTNSVILAGKQLERLIRKHCRDVPIEYLPVAIYDHRKRLLSDEYVVVNPLETHDCIDLEKSDVLWDNGPGSEILGVDDLVIDRKRGAKAPQLFRPRHAASTYILRYDLALEIKNEDLSNVSWTKLVVSG